MKLVNQQKRQQDGEPAPSTHHEEKKPGYIMAFGKLLLVMIMTTFKTVVATTTSGAIHKSALFLLVFLVVHMLGNLTIFFGKDAFNLYSHSLISNPLITFIELYLLLGGVIHGGIGLFLSYKKRKLLMKGPIKYGKLFLTSLVVTVFIVLHLRAFRFGPHYETKTADGTLVRDVWKLELDIFSDPFQVLFYIASVIIVGIHLWHGWPKTVPKMNGIDKEQDEKPFVFIGHFLIIPLCIGFAVTPIYAWYLTTMTTSS